MIEHVMNRAGKPNALCLIVATLNCKMSQKRAKGDGEAAGKIDKKKHVHLLERAKFDDRDVPCVRGGGSWRTSHPKRVRLHLG